MLQLLWRAGVLPGSEGPAASLPVEADNQVAVCNAKVTVCAGIFAGGDVCGRSCSSFFVICSDSPWTSRHD